MSRKERLSVATLLIVAVLGHLVRVILMDQGAAPGGLVIHGAAAADPLLHRASIERLARPLAAGQRIDLNRAGAQDIARLPRISLRLAKTVARARDARGGFTGLADLDSVPGIGPGTLAAIEAHVTFSDTARVRHERDRRNRGRAVATERPQPVAPNVVREPRPGRSGRPASGPPIRLNSASPADLERLPGIGPAKARAIVAYRQGNGPFASVADLEKVPGISRRLVRQLAGQVAVP